MQNNNKLTSRSFWVDYWNKHDCVVPKAINFEEFIPKTLNANSSFIEIGGFPGAFSLYFKKKYNCDCFLLDFYIDQVRIHEMERKNGFPENTLHCIESDFFEFNQTRKFDYVFSYGFIEHFEDTRKVIEKHIELMCDGANLLVTIPNFLGFNGWIQKVFDKDNYKAHNLKSMDVEYLRKIMEKSGVSQYQVTYVKHSGIWLESKPGIINFFLRTAIKGVSVVLRLVRVRTRILSTYIIITAKK